MTRNDKGYVPPPEVLEADKKNIEEYKQKEQGVIDSIKNSKCSPEAIAATLKIYEIFLHTPTYEFEHLTVAVDQALRGDNESLVSFLCEEVRPHNLSEEFITALKTILSTETMNDLTSKVYKSMHSMGP